MVLESSNEWGKDFLQTECPFCHQTSLSSWRKSFSRNLPPLWSSTRTVYPLPSAGPWSLWHSCHGRSGEIESRWWVADHRHVSIPAMAAHHLSPWYRFEGSDWLVWCVSVWQHGQNTIRNFSDISNGVWMTGKAFGR